MPHDFTRRALLCRSARFAAGVAAGGLGACVPALGQGQDAFQNWLQTAWQCRDRQDWEGCERALLSARRLRRLDEGQLRALTFAQLRAKHFDAAFATATENARANPCVASYANMVDASIDYQDFAAARRHLRILDEHKADWGEFANAINLFRDKVITRANEISYEFDAVRYPQGYAAGVVPAFLPSDHVPYQKVSWEVRNGLKHEIKQAGDIKYLLVTPRGRDPFQVVCQVERHALTYMPLIRKRGGWTIPKSIEPYLGKSSGVDPTTDLARSVASKLKRSTLLHTIQSVLDWCKESFTYDPSTDPIVNDSEAMLKTHRGVCMPTARAAVALHRAAGVPAREVRGFSILKEGTQLAWHSWHEVYIGGVGWVPVEIGWPVGNSITCFIRHYSALAPDSLMPFPWSQFYKSSIERFTISKERQYLPATDPEDAIRPEAGAGDSARDGR